MISDIFYGEDIMDFVYILDTQQLKKPHMYEDMYNKMPYERQKKTDAFIFEKDRLLSLGAGILLHNGLAAFGCADSDILYGKNGKPYLKDKKTHFNLSHSGKLAVCAFSDDTVGIDVEEVRTFDDDLANFVYHKSEIDYIRSNFAVHDEGFTLLWTIKESIMKYLGTGIGLGARSITLDRNEPISAVCDSHDISGLSFTTFETYEHMITVCSSYPDFVHEIEWFK